MENVTTFKTVRNNSTALVVVEEMEPKEALKMHTTIKQRGRGAIQEFVQNETPYKNYGGYYYQMKKLGIMPMTTRGSYDKSQQQQTAVVPTQSRIDALEEELRQIKSLLSKVNTTPCDRAISLLSSSYGALGYSSRKFLAYLVTHNPADLSSKQEKWLTDLEQKHLS